MAVDSFAVQRSKYHKHSMQGHQTLRPGMRLHGVCARAAHCRGRARVWCFQELERDEEDEAEAAAAAAAGNVAQTGAQVGGDDGDIGLKPQDIDAYWLQREISKAFGGQEAAQSQKLANEVFAILKVCNRGIKPRRGI